MMSGSAFPIVSLVLHCCRIELFTKALDEEYKRLKAAGVECVSEPVVIRFGNKAGAKFFCFKDPDGTFLELIEPFNG